MLNQRTVVILAILVNFIKYSGEILEEIFNFQVLIVEGIIRFIKSIFRKVYNFVRYFITLDLDIYLKFLTAVIFISCLVLSAFKAYEDSYLSSLNLLLISLFSAFINDRILLQPETENLEEDD